MNIRWPLWLPATAKDFGFFLIQFAAIAYLLLGHFSNLPLIPTFDKMPTNPKELYLWLLVVSVINWLVVIKYARNDYIFYINALLPSLFTWILFTVIFTLAVWQADPSIHWGHFGSNKNSRLLLYGQVYVFVILNISLLFKDNNSPVRDIAKEIQYVHDLWRRRKDLPSRSQAERQESFENLAAVLEALRAALIKNAASFVQRTKQSAGVRIKERVEKAISLLKDRGTENTFKELSNDGSELFNVLKPIAEYRP
jgi:hypothetical protein